jgi:hypothetical protein
MAQLVDAGAAVRRRGARAENGILEVLPDVPVLECGADEAWPWQTPMKRELLNPPTSPLLADVSASPDFRAIVARQKAELEAIYDLLKSARFAFEFPDEAWLPPSERTEELLAYYTVHGCPLPPAIAEFYRQIGGVNFIGWSSAWDDDEYPDALNVLPLELLVEEFESDWAGAAAADRDRMRQAFGGFYFSFSPDYLHKQDISGGPAYGCVLPSLEADPKVQGIPWDVTFTGYIDFAISKDCFPGLDYWKHQMHG